jgi:hypothetical protein
LADGFEDDGTFHGGVSGERKRSFREGVPEREFGNEKRGELVEDGPEGVVVDAEPGAFGFRGGGGCCLRVSGARGSGVGDGGAAEAGHAAVVDAADQVTEGVEGVVVVLDGILGPGFGLGVVLVESGLGEEVGTGAVEDAEGAR